MANWHTLLVEQMKFLGNDDESSVQELLGILDPFDRISFSYNDNLLFGPLEQHNPYNDPRIRRENAPSQYGTSQYCDSDYFDFLDQEGHSVKYYKDSEGDTQFTIEWNEDESLSEIDDDPVVAPPTQVMPQADSPRSRESTPPLMDVEQSVRFHKRLHEPDLLPNDPIPKPWEMMTSAGREWRGIGQHHVEMRTHTLESQLETRFKYDEAQGHIRMYVLDVRDDESEQLYTDSNAPSKLGEDVANMSDPDASNQGEQLVGAADDDEEVYEDRLQQVTRTWETADAVSRQPDMQEPLIIRTQIQNLTGVIHSCENALSSPIKQKDRERILNLKGLCSVTLGSLMDTLQRVSHLDITHHTPVMSLTSSSTTEEEC